MKYPHVDPKFSLSQEKLSEIPLVPLGEISDTFTLDSENLLFGVHWWYFSQIPLVHSGVSGVYTRIVH